MKPIDTRLLGVVLLLMSTSAWAQLYEIRALGGTTPGGGGSSVTTSDWTLVFDDTGDQLLQVEEIVSFSGATVTTSLGGPYQYDAIVGTPAVAGISTESGGLNPCCWWFTGSVMAEVDQDGWFPTRWPAYQIEMLMTSPEAMLGDLVSRVLELNLHAGRRNALDARLQNALEALDRAQGGDSPAAIGMLYSFINSVEAQRGRAIPEPEADELIGAAEAVIAVLEAG
ncbi:MAG: hypothetical protein RIB46_10040 [Pseudomonadales bacterium]